MAGLRWEKKNSMVFKPKESRPAGRYPSKRACSLSGAKRDPSVSFRLERLKKKGRASQQKKAIIGRGRCADMLQRDLEEGWKKGGRKTEKIKDDAEKA